jgi:hypothetical protein
MKANIHVWSYLSQFFLELEMFQTKFLEKNHNAHFILNNVFSKIVTFMIEEKYCRTGQATYDNMAHAQAMLAN